MKVILKSDVEKLGRTGELKSVADGYARNFLLPRGLALRATAGSVRAFEKGREKREKLYQAGLSAARETASKLSDVTLRFTRPGGGEQGKLFGSVGKADIAKSLQASGFEVDKGAVRLEAAIRNAGETEVEIRLHPEVSAKVKISILARA